MKAQTLVIGDHSEEKKEFVFASPSIEDLQEHPIFLSREGVAYDNSGNALPFSFLSMPQQHLEAELKTTIARIFDSRSGSAIPCDEHIYVPALVPGYWNYYHLLIDCVPRILFSLRSTLPTTRLLITKFQAARLQRALPNMLDQMGGIFSFDNRLEIAEGDMFQIRKSLIPKERVRFIGAATQIFFDVAARFPSPTTLRRVYISRKHTSARRVINEESVLSVLQDFGFVTVYLEKMSLAEQIGVFRAAEVVVGPHGAGLANIVFSRFGTTLIEFLQNNGTYKLPIFSELVALAGGRHIALPSKPEANSQHPGHPGNMDMTVDCEKLRALLHTMLA